MAGSSPASIGSVVVSFVHCHRYVCDINLFAGLSLQKQVEYYRRTNKYQAIRTGR